MQQHVEWSLKRFVRARRILSPRPPESRLPSTSRIRESARSLGIDLSCPFEQTDCIESPGDHCANEPEPFVRYLSSSCWLCVLVLTLLPLPVPGAFGAVREVASIGMTVDNLGPELNFFTNTLPFELISIADAGGRDQDALLGMTGVRMRIASLKLGDESITLTEHLGKKGRSIPPDSRSFDHWFQHIAIVVSDMEKAYTQLLGQKVRHVSTAPQTLPEWNKDAGGIKAFYFRDPEDHVLELICFPSGKGNPKWQNTAGRLFLGIDHTAIVVSDIETSLAFYRGQLGFKVVGSAHNFGPEQEHLHQVFRATLRITALRTERGPGIEFLEYLAPPGGRDLPSGSRANDLTFWITQLVVDDLPGLTDLFRVNKTEIVSKPNRNARASIVRDPDGHALQLNSSPLSLAHN